MQYQQVYGVFANVENAERAISAIKDHGADGNEISVVRRADGKGLANIEQGGSHGITVTTAEDATAGALKGGAAGIALGVLAGAIALTIPGVGPILAAGPLWTAFGAAAATGVAGAAIGGVVGYLVDQGVPSERAHLYADAIHRGDMLVSVRSNHVLGSEVATLLEKYGATEVGNHQVGTPTDAQDPLFAGLDESEENRNLARQKSVGTPIAPAVVATEDTLYSDEGIGETPFLSPITPALPNMPGPIGR